jgi:hypothetical protein
MPHIFRILFLLLIPGALFAQTDTTAEEDYSQYGSAEETVKYCSQKVRLLSPTKLISIGAEYQAPFVMDIQSESARIESSYRTAFVGGGRGQVNAPVISNNRFILNLGANYYETFFGFSNSASGPETSFGPPMRSALERGLRTVGLLATAFKPLNEKRFLIFNVQGDLNGNFGWSNMDLLPAPTLTVAALYGWKRDDNTQLAFGATQTWRGGERLYVPLILFNKTFSDRWGLEMLLPARAHLRYNFSSKSLLLGGFEIEGNSYQLRAGKADFLPEPGRKNRFLELRRAELKFRMIYERQLYGFIWVSAQAGMRYNFKFNISDSRSSSRGDFLYTTRMGHPFYCHLSLNLVSP